MADRNEHAPIGVAILRQRTFGGDNRTDDKFRVTTSNGLGCDVPIYGRN